MRVKRPEVIATGLVLLLVLSATPVSGQLSPVGGGNTGAFDRARVPNSLQPHLRALGSRTGRRGREQILLQGEFADDSGFRSQAQAVVQLPGLVRLEGMRADGSPLLFDGQDTRSSLTARDQAVLDVFAVDSVEGLLGLAAEGAGVRLIGRGFGPDRAKPEEAGQPVYDIFDVVFARPTRGDHPVETRQYYFDSDTGLLSSVFRMEGQESIETRYSGWAQIDGDMYPGRIERYRGGRLTFAFTTQAAGAGPATDTTIFRVP